MANVTKTRVRPLDNHLLIPKANGDAVTITGKRKK
ncbi:MAG: hypothetical protein ACJAXA_002663 [Candidatus Aldehydirespiratoraceae bacterium]|jgi:hypothetical protein